MKRKVTWLIVAALFLVPGMAAAQAPAGAPASPQAQQESPTQAQPQCQPGPGGTCVMPGQMTPEQMKQMQGKMGQCCVMQEGKGCPMHQQMQKQLDELRQRVEALEKQLKAKKK